MRDGISVKIVDVTPKMAERWLYEKNTKNRKMYENVVNRYALDMKRGNWALNHQGISFCEDGSLLDGQHRLKAIVISGKTITLMVTRNIPISYGKNGSTIFTRDTIDESRMRTAGDKLTLSYGIKEGNLTSSILASVIRICTGNTLKRSTQTIKAIYDIYEKEIKMIMSNKQRVSGLCVTPALGAFTFAAKVYPKEVLSFEDKYFSGEELKKGSPILAYRNFMFSKDPQGNRASRDLITTYAFTAMMNHILQKSMKQFRTSDSGRMFFSKKQARTIDKVKEELRL